MTDLFASEPITAAEKLAEIARERALRHRVYPRWVADGKLSQDKADRQLAVMAAIERDYTQVAGIDRPLVEARILTFRQEWGDQSLVLTFDTEVRVIGQERPRLARVVASCGAYEMRQVARSIETALTGVSEPVAPAIAQGA